jgi:hypothetical protein
VSSICLLCPHLSFEPIGRFFVTCYFYIYSLDGSEISFQSTVGNCVYHPVTSKVVLVFSRTSCGLVRGSDVSCTSVNFSIQLLLLLFKPLKSSSKCMFCLL